MSLSRDLRALADGWRWGRRPLYPSSVPQREEPSHGFSTAWARSPAARAARSAILSGCFRPLLAYELSRRVDGVEVLDAVEPPVVFAANHSSHLDAPSILTALPMKWRRMTAVGAAADYFFDVWWRAAATALAFAAFPVERAGSKRSSGQAASLLAGGWSVLVFPEGTRSADGSLRDFRVGAARLAINSKVPIVPITLRGNFPAMPRGRSWPLPGRPEVHLRFLPPLFPEPGESAGDLTGRLRESIRSGLVEGESTWWEALRRSSAPSEGESTEAPHWRRLWDGTRPLSRRGLPGAWGPR